MWKVIIAGGRELVPTQQHYDEIDRLLSSHPSYELVTGCARGADQIPYAYEKARGTSVKEFPADWNTHGRGAGFIRNAEMADYSDALIAFWDGTSKGTKHMIDVARKKGLCVSVISYAKPVNFF
jgi:hypothetical protein